MKKLLILLAALVLMSGVAFGQFYAEVNVGFPVHWTNGMHEDFWAGSNGIEEDKMVTANTALGLGLVFDFNKRIGIMIDADFFFGARLSGYSIIDSGFNSLFGANFFLGPVIYLFNNDWLKVPLGIGPHMYLFIDDLWMEDVALGVTSTSGEWIKRTEMQIGAGLFLGVQFHFETGFYIFSRTMVSVDFLRFHNVKAKGMNDLSHMCIDINWGIKPYIGVGIKF